MSDLTPLQRASEALAELSITSKAFLATPVADISAKSLASAASISFADAAAIVNDLHLAIETGELDGWSV